jgi:hypothetical protein
MAASAAALVASDMLNRLKGWLRKKPGYGFLAGAIVAVAAVAVGVLGLLHLIGGSAAIPAGAPAAAPGPHSAGAPAPSQRLGPNLLVIPSIGTTAPVVAVGAAGPDGGALDVPSRIDEVGWWDGTWQSPEGVTREKVAKPGQPGVALLAGHIDSAVQGEGALYRLQQVKQGADITVTDDHSRATHWRVTWLQVVPKTELPAALFVNHGPPRLAVVSCGGPFDTATGHYVDNVIAWAVPVT